MLNKNHKEELRVFSNDLNHGQVPIKQVHYVIAVLRILNGNTAIINWLILLYCENL